MNANVIGNFKSYAVAIHVRRKFFCCNTKNWADDLGEGVRSTLVLRENVGIIGGIVIAGYLQQHAIVKIHKFDTARIGSRLVFWIDPYVSAELKRLRRVDCRDRTIKRENLLEISRLCRFKPRVLYFVRANLGAEAYATRQQQTHERQHETQRSSSDLHSDHLAVYFGPGLAGG